MSSKDPRNLRCTYVFESGDVAKSMATYAPLTSDSPLHMHEALLPGDVCPQSETFSKPI